MRLLLAAACAALGTAAFAQSSFTYSGDTTGAATFQRPAGLSSYSPNNARTRYQATEFSVSATGTYIGELNAAFSPYLLVYQDSFDPNNSLTNLLNGDRTYVDAFTILPGSGTGQGPATRSARIYASEAPDSNNEQFVRGTGLQLQAGRKYIAVVTAFYAPDDAAAVLFGFPTQGAYSVGLGGGPGNVTAFQAVPEPATMAVLGLGAAALLRRKRKSA